jgi:microsomal epoxide hydrolase
MSLPFSTLPSAARVSPTPFKADIPKDKLSELKQLIEVSKLAPRTYSQTDRRYGITTDWLATMREQWLTSYHWYYHISQT